MHRYNKIMLYFYLFASVAMFLFVTGMCIKDSFRNWGYYYILVVITFLMYLLRRYMMKRMEAHMEFLEKQQEEQK